MILGLDVGGTQTDAVLIKDGRVLAQVKTANRPELLDTLAEALSEILADIPAESIRRMVFSTTMATNAIVADDLTPAGMIVSAGPGMDPCAFAVGPSYHVVPGCMDHRGMEVVPVDREAVRAAARAIRDRGIGVAGVAGKFSVRNALHETQMAQWVQDDFSYVAMGHIFSGNLNFPRRISTAYLNAALQPIHSEFVTTLQKSLDGRGLTAPRYLMKPDGGTVRLGKSHRFPAQTAQSGPAASVMGALALDGCKGVTLILDIGGTTTDMALTFHGVPLVEPRGITLGAYSTSIRSLLTKSIGMGGDSRVRVDDRGKLRAGPLREGSPRALGGPYPTPTDAMVHLGLLPVGEKAAADAAMAEIAGALSLDSRQAADQVLCHMAETIALSAEAFIFSVNCRPVYTIYEVLEGVRVRPDSVVVIGGPAAVLAPYLEKAFGLPVRVPAHAEVANAVGAAAARVTAEVSLQADTQRGTAVIPELGKEYPVRRDFSMDQALAMAKDALTDRAFEEGAQTDGISFAVTEKEEFNMIRGGMRAGKNIRVKISVVPGIIPEWKFQG
ncbi:MAG: hydantoinase/oxoprolinase family protein [Thermodesulfobacteriota bacterium]